MLVFYFVREYSLVGLVVIMGEEVRVADTKLPTKEFVRDLEVEFQFLWSRVGGKIGDDVFDLLAADMHIEKDLLFGMRSDFGKTDFEIGGVTSDGFWALFANCIEFYPNFAKRYGAFGRNFFPGTESPQARALIAAAERRVALEQAQKK